MWPPRSDAGIGLGIGTRGTITGAIISMAEEIAVQAQERAGSQEEFELDVCTTAQQLPLDTYDRPTRAEILIEPYGIETAVVVFPTAQRDKDN